MNVTRGNYGEIDMQSLTERTRKIVKNLVDEISNVEKVDEHGSWDFGAEFDSKSRGTALNWDLYAVGRDAKNQRTLAVIQVRQYHKRSTRSFARVRKNYFLCGRNEDGTAFAHPVSAHVVRRAVNDDVDVIQRVQRWIFDGTEYADVVRQGDLALVPLQRAPAGEELDAATVTLEESHILVADRIKLNGSLYALNPRLEHIPGTHPEVDGSGWYKIVIGQRSDFWNFAAPTID